MDDNLESSIDYITYGSVFFMRSINMNIESLCLTRSIIGKVKSGNFITPALYETFTRSIVGDGI